MPKEFKHVTFTNIKAEETNPRIKTGICAVFGNVDSWGDRIHAGAFKKTLSENLQRVRHLWNHDSHQPPIASILEIREVSREELPSKVLAKAPEATGGLLVKREYYDNEFANWILEAIEKGDINEMSFAYEVIKSSETVEETGFEDMPKRYIRELLELRLFDTSDVNWGMNSATVAVGAKSQILSLGQIYSQLTAIKQLKEGRRNAESDQILLNQIHQIAVDLGASCDSKHADSTDEKAEAGISTSLEWLEVAKRKATALNI